MAAREPKRSCLLTAWGPVVLVLALLAGGLATYRWDLGERWFGTSTTPPSPDPDTEPAAVPPPAGVTLPLPPSPAPVAVAVGAADDGRMAPRKVARVLDPLLDDADLGKDVVAAVAHLSSGELVYERGVSARPASTTKLLTAAAALHVLGPDHRFSTRVVLEGQGWQRRLVLVGGGDPLLARRPPAKDEPAYPERADLRTLAGRTAQALAEQGIRRVRLAYDNSLFTGPEVSPRWEPGYAGGGVVAHIQALWADEGLLGAGYRVGDPSFWAAREFARHLRGAGVSLRGSVGQRVATADAKPVAEVGSAPVSQVVERMLTTSDNEAAEALLRHVGHATGHRASFTGGIKGVRQALGELGVQPAPEDRWYDGSGLSRDNVLTPATLLAVLRVAASADHPELRALVTGLPVAGFTGSLEYRFVDTMPAARGRVRAKTGTLRGTSSLAGIATDLDGTAVAFVLMADRVPILKTLAARDALDAAAAALGGCRCSMGASR